MKLSDFPPSYSWVHFGAEMASVTLLKNARRPLRGPPPHLRAQLGSPLEPSAEHPAPEPKPEPQPEPQPEPEPQPQAQRRPMDGSAN